MVIRRAVPDDVQGVRECAEKAYQRYVARLGRTPVPVMADFAAQIVAGHVYVDADEAGSVQGFIVFYPKERHMFLENVAVLPEAGGQGIGRGLIEYCEAQARRTGMAAVHLYTNEVMTENLEMYPHMGYIEFARRREDGFNRVYFEKRLD